MRKYHHICSTFVTWFFTHLLSTSNLVEGLDYLYPASPPAAFLYGGSCKSLPGFRITLLRICPVLRPRSDSSLRPASTRKSAAPSITTVKAPTINHLSRLNSTASALAVYASHYGHPACARLASVCWSDFDGWDSHPLGYKRNFKDHLILFQSTGLSLAPRNLWLTLVRL